MKKKKIRKELARQRAYTAGVERRILAVVNERNRAWAAIEYLSKYRSDVGPFNGPEITDYICDEVLHLQPIEVRNYTIGEPIPKTSGEGGTG